MMEGRSSKPFLVVGVVNITPDSFSDGGRFGLADCALKHACRLAEEGADIIEFGAESTRPGSLPVDPAEEWTRLAPVLRRWSGSSIPARLGLDTRHGELMVRALDFGASHFNSIVPPPNGTILNKLSSALDAHFVSMHMHGTPQTMQDRPLSRDQAVRLVDDYFLETQQQLLDGGFSSEQVFVDPGIGFGKTDSANYALLSRLGYWSPTYNVAIGVSRKSFLGRWLDIELPTQRDLPSKGLELGCVLSGARMIRTHEVAPLVRLRKILASP